eukprot:937930-Pyramimonas_sp.AAC.1
MQNIPRPDQSVVGGGVARTPSWSSVAPNGTSGGHCPSRRVSSRVRLPLAADPSGVKGDGTA